MRIATPIILLAFVVCTSAHTDSSNVSVKTICTVDGKNGSLLPYPFAGPGRKLLAFEDFDEKALSTGRNLKTVTMFWSFWETESGKCAATFALPLWFVKAATQPNQKVNPGGSCSKADFIGTLTSLLVEKYTTKCPKSTAKNLLLSRVCDYSYGSRGASYIMGKYVCKGGAKKTSTIKVWAEYYRNPDEYSTGTWHV